MLCTHSVVYVSGRRGVSGSAACRWYINEDLPDVLNFRRGYVCLLLYFCDVYVSFYAVEIIILMYVY
jgi:hypothetical protein